MKRVRIYWGGTLLMPNSAGGKKVLIDRGLSPRTEVTAKVDTKDFIKKVTDFEELIARELGAKAILVPLRKLESGLGTNNPDVIGYYERTLGGEKPVNLDQENTFNGHNITRGKCVVFRDILSEGSSHNDNHSKAVQVPNYHKFSEEAVVQSL